MTAAMVLIVLIISGILALFLSPYDPTIAGRNKDYLNGAECTDVLRQEWLLSSAIFHIERELFYQDQFPLGEKVNEDKWRYVQFFVTGSERSSALFQATFTYRN